MLHTTIPKPMNDPTKYQLSALYTVIKPGQDFKVQGHNGMDNGQIKITP